MAKKKEQTPSDPELEAKKEETKQDEKPVIKSQIERIRDFVFEKYDFRYNVLTQTLEYRELNGVAYDQLTDQIKTDIIIALKQCMYKKPKEDLDDLFNSSMIPRFDPIKEYFNSIPYNGDGYIAKLARCIVLDEPEKEIAGKPYKELFRSYFERWLMACYLCSTGRLTNDIMLILIGAQGRFKTSFLNFLTPARLADYRVCSHINPTLTDYNTANFLAEKFFINVDDQMENIFGKDYNSMKAIISAPDITNRKLYRASHQRRRRIANFCGSVNESRFLRDSNNRRYLCFAISDIKPEYSQVDIDGVWAEVKHKADAANLMYIFGKEDYRLIDLMNASFEAPTEEAEALTTIFQPADPYKDNVFYYMQFTEILKVLRLHTGNNSLKSYNLQTAMRKYGYITRSVKQNRFAMQPRNLYAVKLVNYSMGNVVKIYQADVREL